MDLCLVIPSYNRADLIINTIESALNQTQAFSQIIVVDDASTDDTLRKLETFGNRITVIASDKVGVQRARNIGVQAAQTDYVILCDSDDLLQPNHVEVISSWLDNHPQCDAVYTNHQVFSGEEIRAETFSRAPAGFFDGARKEGSFLSDIPHLYLKSATFQPLLVSGVTLKKSFYNKIGGFDPEFDGVPSEDWEFTLRVVNEGNVALCVEPITLIRRHPGNDSKSALRQRLGEIVVLEHALKSHMCPATYHSEFNAIIDKHRLWAFEQAFGTNKLRLAAAIFPLLRKRRRSFKFLVKSALIRLYIAMPNYKVPPLHTQYADASR